MWCGTHFSWLLDSCNGPKYQLSFVYIHFSVYHTYGCMDVSVVLRCSVYIFVSLYIMLQSLTLNFMVVLITNWMLFTCNIYIVFLLVLILFYFLIFYIFMWRYPPIIYTKEEVRLWREARKRNFPIQANMKRVCSVFFFFLELETCWFQWNLKIDTAFW